MDGMMILLAAYVLDRLIGDPRWLPHPVVGMGRCISFLEKGLRRLMHARQWQNDTHPLCIRLLGLLFPIVIVSGVYVSVFFIVKFVFLWNEWAGRVLEVFLLSTTIATRGLAEAARKIYRAPQAKDLEQARYALSMVVGRDTEKLDEKEIVRGGVETVAENIVDAVTSPLFYAMLGGVPLAMAYRAINTLDSMVGYRNEKYLHLGWASARLDDLANWLPARLTIFPMLAALWLCELHPRQAWKTYRQDAHHHPSPNSGIPESIMAGGLQIQLGGINTYEGRISNRRAMGQPVQEKKPVHLLEAIRVLFWSSTIYTGLLCAGVWLWREIFDRV